MFAWNGELRFLSHQASNYEYIADIVAPLRDLTHKGVEFKWLEVQQQALDQLKCSLTSDDVMAYFYPRKKTVLIVKASRVG